MKLPRYIARRRVRLARNRWRGSDPSLDRLRADLATAGEVWQELQRFTADSVCLRKAVR